ncbi:hypothetical protein F5148DRAFT_1280054 [Russula earlei]|uniref:Uncharacterized protein n=1 Tax=Russula earlei TaxID=71964 RepID=A0ACC0UKP8_9AGAM|nr:hypothetical protein F5148DRAFT_1280054 [Russula earlei]
MGVTGLWDILRPSGKLRSLTNIAVVDGFERNHANLKGLRIGIDASIWFFHAAHGKEGENPELRTLFFRCARLMSAPFLPLFIFDGPKRPKVKRGKRISGEKHWLVDSMKGIVEAYGFEWRMAPGEAEAELAHLNNTGVIDAILSDDVDNFLFGAKMVIRNPSINLSGNSKHAAKNADGRVDGNHSTVYTSVDILAHPSVQLTRGGLILIGLLSGGDYHQAGLSRCGPGIAHGLAKCGLGDELLEAAQSLSRADLVEFLTKWREALRNELRTNSRGHVGSKRPSLAKAVPDSFPDVDVLLSYANPITSATDAGARRTHAPPKWEREPDLAKIAHLCELHFEWGLKDIIMKRFRTVLWPSIVLRFLRRSALELDAKTIAPPLTSERDLHHDPLGTPSKKLARHFSSLTIRTNDEEDKDCNLEDLVIKIHASRTHAYTDGILEYRLEIAPALLVHLASSGIQGLRKPADTTYDVLPSESDDNDEVSDDNEGRRGGTSGRKKRRGGPPPEPESHMRVWMPACMVRLALPDLVERYEVALEAKKSKKSKARPRDTARAPATKGKRRAPLPPPRSAVEAVPVSSDAEHFDLDVSSCEEESDGRASPLPLRNHSRRLPAILSQGTPLPTVHTKEPYATVDGGVFVGKYGVLFPDGICQHSAHSQERPERVFSVFSEDEHNDDVPEPSKTLIRHLSSPSNVLQRLDLNLDTSTHSPRKVRPSITPVTPSSSPPRVLQPFPVAFETSDGGHDPSIPTTSKSLDHRHGQHRRPLSVARGREEEFSDDDDPDAIPAELPILHLLTQRGRSRSSTHPSPSHVSPSPLMHDSSDLGLERNTKRAYAQQPSLSKARRRSSRQPRSTNPTPDDDDDIPDLVDQWRREAETSIISISSDSDDGSGDSDDVALPPVAAPLLIARSRTTVPRQSATTADWRQKGANREVIDLT